MIFCHRPLECGILYEEMCQMQGNDFTEPPGMPHKIPQLRLLDTYNGGTISDVSSVVLKQFCDQDSCLCIIIATVAFGMGKC